MKPSVKICGIRTMEAAKTAIEAGADFLGFNFVPGSKRFIDPKEATPIIDKARVYLACVGVFKDAELTYVQEIAKLLQLDYIQLHGSETSDYCKKIKTPIIKTIQIADEPLQSIEMKMRAYTVQYYLLDRTIQGEGDMVATETAATLAKKFPVMYAGGLTPENVHSIIKQVKPKGVDVAGGVETDGKQDLEKIKKFIQNAKL